MLHELLKSQGIDINEEETEAHKWAWQSSMQQRKHIDERVFEIKQVSLLGDDGGVVWF